MNDELKPGDGIGFNGACQDSNNSDPLEIVEVVDSRLLLSDGQLVEKSQVFFQPTRTQIAEGSNEIRKRRTQEKSKSSHISRGNKRRSRADIFTLLGDIKSSGDGGEGGEK